MDEKKDRIVKVPLFLGIAAIILFILTFVFLEIASEVAIPITIFFIGWAVSLAGIIIAAINKKRNPGEKKLFGFALGISIFAFLCHLIIFLFFMWFFLMFEPNEIPVMDAGAAIRGLLNLI